MTNAEMAQILEEVADLLDAQEANQYRVQAYRAAAITLRGLEQPAGEILAEQGVDGLIELPAIGRSIAHSVEQMIHTGRLNLLDRLRGATDPARVFTTVPTIGPKLAERIHDTLDIETLAELQGAAYDGRLAQVSGFGPKRVRAVQDTLAGRLSRSEQRARRQQAQAIANEPPVAELLDVDAEYRRLTQANKLPRIAPRRFNPTREAWLPILHTQRDSTHYTALFSNTARAHELNTIRDWVVIYRDDEDGDGQWTVVTSQFGPLRGRRIVRGREGECQAYYSGQEN